MTALTSTGENQALNWLTGNTTTAPVLPLQLALVTALGSDTTPGTEATGGSYARQDLTAGAASGGQASNTGLIRFSDLADGDYVGAEVWDSAGTPVRWWHGALDETRTVSGGGSIEFAAGAVVLAQD